MHRAEALRIVNQRLRESPRHISEETIGAIAALANFEVRMLSHIINSELMKFKLDIKWIF